MSVRGQWAAMGPGPLGALPPAEDVSSLGQGLWLSLLTRVEAVVWGCSGPSAGDLGRGSVDKGLLMLPMVVAGQRESPGFQTVYRLLTVENGCGTLFSGYLRLNTFSREGCLGREAY